MAVKIPISMDGATLDAGIEEYAADGTRATGLRLAQSIANLVLYAPLDEATFAPAYSAGPEVATINNAGGSALLDASNPAVGAAGSLLIDTQYDEVAIPIQGVDGGAAGCIEFFVRPAYTGTPSAVRQVILIPRNEKSNVSGEIHLDHFTNGTLRALIRNDAATQYSVAPAWSPTAGTWYHVSLNWDFDAGVRIWELFIGGVSQGTATVAGTRTAPGYASSLKIGQNDILTRRWDGGSQEMTVYSTRFRTANFTPPTAQLAPFSAAAPTATLAEMDAGANDSTWDMSSIDVYEAPDAEAGSLAYQYSASNSSGVHVYNGTWLTLAQLQAETDDVGRYFSLQVRFTSNGKQRCALKSGEMSVTPGTTVDAPTFAGLATAADNGDGSVALAWAAATFDGAIPAIDRGYEIHVHTAAMVDADLDADTYLLGRIPGTRTSFDAFTTSDGTTRLTSGVTYYFAVRAFQRANGGRSEDQNSTNQSAEPTGASVPTAPAGNTLLIAYNDVIIGGGEHRTQIGAYSYQQSYDTWAFSAEFLVQAETDALMTTRITELMTTAGLTQPSATLVVQAGILLAVTDLVADGTTTVTSATGGFTAAMEGTYITIVGLGARKIVTRTDTNTVVLGATVATGTYAANVGRVHYTRGLMARATIEKVGDMAVDRLRSQRMRFSATGHVESSDDINSGFSSDSRISFALTGSNRRVVTFRGHVTATAALTALARYTANVAAWVATHLATIGGNYELSGQPETEFDPDNKILSFVRTYIERIIPDSVATADVAQIANQSLVLTRTQTPVHGDAGRQGPVGLVLSYSCDIDRAVSTQAQIQTLYTGTIKPNLLSLIRTQYSTTTVIILDENVSPAVAENKLMVGWRVMLPDISGNLLSYVYFIERPVDQAITLVPLWDGRSETYAGWTSTGLVRTLTETITAVSIKSPPFIQPPLDGPILLRETPSATQRTLGRTPEGDATVTEYTVTMRREYLLAEVSGVTPALRLDSGQDVHSVGPSE